jgi:hypothetical protein
VVKVRSRGRTPRPLTEDGLRLLDRFSDDVQELVLVLRGRVLGVVPHATEVITDVGYTLSFRYGPDAKNTRQFAYITGFSAHANLGFIDGARLPDPAKVLAGDGARMRHVKFRTLADIVDATWLDPYLVAALDQAGLDGDMGDGTTHVRPRTR